MLSLPVASHPLDILVYSLEGNYRREENRIESDSGGIGHVQKTLFLGGPVPLLPDINIYLIRLVTYIDIHDFFFYFYLFEI